MFSGVTFFSYKFLKQIELTHAWESYVKKGLMQQLERASVILTFVPIVMFLGVTFILYILKILV